MQGQGSSTNGMFPGDSPLTSVLSSTVMPLMYLAPMEASTRSLFVDGLNFSLNNMQYSNQQFQPVMAN